MKRMLFFIIFLSLWALPSIAMDFSNEVTGPQLHATTDLRVDAVDISINPQKISVAYTFTNDSPSSVKVPFRFFIPPYKWVGFGQEDAYGNFNGLKVFINGKQTDTPIRNYAFWEGKNISQLIEVKGIQVGFDNIQNFTHTNKNTIGLEPWAMESGLFEKCDDCYPGTNTTVYAPLWTVLSTCSFIQEVEKGKQLTIKYEYTPYPGFGAATSVSNSYGIPLQRNDFKQCFPNDSGKQYYVFKWFTFDVNKVLAELPAQKISITVDSQENANSLVAVIAHKASTNLFDKRINSKSIQTTFTDMTQYDGNIQVVIAKQQ